MKWIREALSGALGFMGGGFLKQRVAYYDNLKGILIVLVVVGHLLEPVAVSANMTTMQFVDFIYLFHMPLFIFVSGLFCKSICKKGIFRADVALFYMTVCFLLYSGLQLERVLLGTFKSYDLFTLSNGSIPWYLMALAAYVVAVPLFSRIKPTVALAGAFFLAIASGFSDAGDFLTASRILVYLPFFLLGFYMRHEWILQSLERFENSTFLWSKLTALRVVAVVGLGILLIGFFMLDEEMLVFCKKLFTGRNSYESISSSSGLDVSVVVCCIARASYYVVVCLASACVMVLTPRRKLFLLTGTGAHSLQTYILHPFVYYALNKYGFSSGLYNALPDSVAFAVLIAIGGCLALLLGAPSFPQRVLDRLKASMKMALVRLPERHCERVL
ncbi:acyltransferase family protein [Paraeggerthella sp. LCP19S3_G8]|uniref:acyltransferase family protein n=1 Tax=Paraeggerthella sp. LCP19S3_G8 TaxID=3440248 RepID=UPI003F9DA39E